MCRFAILDQTSFFNMEKANDKLQADSCQCTFHIKNNFEFCFQKLYQNYNPDIQLYTNVADYRLKCG